MRFIADHDLHNHSFISPCSSDPRQTKEAILAYAVTNGYRLVCLTDHAWDAKVDCPCHNSWLKRGVDLDKIRENLPLPQTDSCHFIFGCEIDMNRFGEIGISREEMDNFDFIILSTSHLNLKKFTIDPEVVDDTAESHKAYYHERLLRLLSLDLPFGKCGLAHFTVGNVCPADKVRVISLFTDEELADIFSRARDCGIGVELNFQPFAYSPEDLKTILRPYIIAKQVGCRFYFGGDAHHPERFAVSRGNIERIIDLLELTEEDKFAFVPRTIERLDKESAASK